MKSQNNKLYFVEEVNKGRFIEYDIETKQVRTITLLSNPEGIAQLSDDSFLITEDAMDGRLVEVNINGEVKEVLLHLSRPESLVIDSVGVIYFTQTALGTVSRYANGKIITVVNNLNEPDQHAFDMSNYLWIGEDAKSARLFSYKDNLLETIAENLSGVQGILPVLMIKYL